MYRLAGILIIAIVNLCASCVKAANVDDLVARSQIVAQVSIMAGRLADGPSPGCGFVYEAQVIDGIRGSTEKEKIRFRLRDSLYIGGVYLVFVTNKTTPKGTKGDLDILLDHRSIDCVANGGPLTIVGLSKHIDYDAIFEMRSLSELSKEPDGPYFVGPAPALSLVPEGVEKYTLTMHRANGPIFRGAIQAEQFLSLVRKAAISLEK